MSDRYASLKQGLVGCWIPSVSGSGLLLPDLSGRGNNGSLVGMDASDWVSNQYGRALDFDGVDDYVSIPHKNEYGTLSTGGTICLWFRTTTTGVFQDIISKPSFNDFEFRIRSDTNKLQLLIGGSTSQIGNAVIATNTWYAVAITFKANESVCYLNGAVDFTAAFSIVDNTSDINIGRRLQYTDFHFQGQMNDIRIYNRALTEPEIRLLSSEPGIGFKRNTSAFATRYAYKLAKPRNYSVIRNRDPNYSTLRQGLVAAYCPSISGQGNVLPDLVGGNHGTLTNMTADDWVSSGDGRALDFDGVDDSVKSNRILPNLTPAFTLSLWVYVRSLPTSGSIVNILSTYYSTGSQLFGFDLRFRNDAGIHKLGLRGGDGTNTTELGSDEVYELPTLRWINLLFTVTSSGAIGYQDSIQIATYSTMRGVPMNANKTLSVGSLGAYSSPGQELGRFFNGVMDDIRIYNRALSEPEIKLLTSKRGIGLEPRKPKITFADLGVQKTYSVVRVKETDYATLRQGLVGAWCPSLPNGGSGNTLPDVSGYGNHGSLVGMSPDDWVSGQYGRALDIFDDQYIDCGAMNGLSLAYPFSMSCWIQNITSNNIDFSPFAKTRQVGTYQGPMIYFASATNSTVVAYWAGGTRATGATVVTQLSNWTHVGICWTGSQARVYVNGRLDGTGNTATAPDASTASVNIGRYNSEGFGQRSMRGKIDDCRIYDRCLTDSEWSLLASRPGIGLRQESHRNTFYQFPSFQPALAKRSSVIIGGGIT